MEQGLDKKTCRQFLKHLLGAVHDAIDRSCWVLAGALGATGHRTAARGHCTALAFFDICALLGAGKDAVASPQADEGVRRRSLQHAQEE